MPYVSPKAAPNTMRDDKVIIGLSEALAGTSLGGASNGSSTSSTRNNSITSSAILTPGAPMPLSGCNTDSSSSVNTMSSGSVASPTIATPHDTPSPPPASAAYDPVDDGAHPLVTTEAMAKYSQGLYAFTMARYNEAQAANLRRSKAKKSHSVSKTERQSVNA